jgi:hypothetical protein
MDTLLKQQELSLKNSCVNFMFAYQQRDVEKMLSFCNPEGKVFFKPLGDSGKGKIYELGKGLWTSLIDSFPDLDNSVDAAIAEDGETIRCQVVIRGTQAKDFAGIISKGKHFESDHIFIFRLNPAGKIINIEIEWDHEDFKRQLGAV